MGKDEEATTADDGFTYTCVFGDVGSTGVGIDVANDGVTVFAESGGTAGNCLEALGSDGVSLTQHVMMWLLRLLFLTQQEVLMISSRVSCSPTVVHSGKEMVSMLVLKELMTQY